MNQLIAVNLLWVCSSIKWAKGQNLPVMLADFRQVRAEQIALLTRYDAESWQYTLPTPAWGDVTLCRVPDQNPATYLRAYPRCPADGTLLGEPGEGAALIKQLVENHSRLERS